jgi:hypothetical protein
MTGLAQPDIALAGGTMYVGPAEPPTDGGAVLLQGDKSSALAPRPSLSVQTAVKTIDCSDFNNSVGDTLRAGNVLYKSS